MKHGSPLEDFDAENAQAFWTPLFSPHLSSPTPEQTGGASFDL